MLPSAGGDDVVKLRKLFLRVGKEPPAGPDVRHVRVGVEAAPNLSPDFIAQALVGEPAGPLESLAIERARGRAVQEVLQRVHELQQDRLLGCGTEGKRLQGHSPAARGQESVVSGGARRSGGEPAGVRPRTLVRAPVVRASNERNCSRMAAPRPGRRASGLHFPL